MAGLLAARVLSDHFARVTVVERDDLATSGDRPGVPQGRHVHALLPRGREILEGLFPGLGAEVIAAGGLECQAMTEARMVFYGHALQQVDAGYAMLQASRPALEWVVRQRVRALPNVTFLDLHEALGLSALGPAGAVNGARVRALGGSEHTVFADLVVSCLGRHGPILDWWDSLGYELPSAEGVAIDMKYASRYVRLAPSSLCRDKQVMVANADPARGLALFAVEGDRHILTLAGYGADHPPDDDEGFWQFAASVAPPDVWEALWAAEPLSDVTCYRYLANERRRFEHLRRSPVGLLVMGDAVCSFSPAFGQGMTMSAVQASVLADALAAGDGELGSRFYRGVGGAINDAWLLTKVLELSMPHVESGPAERVLLGSLTRAALALGQCNPVVARQLARTAGLLDPLHAAVRPRVVVGGLAAAGPLLAAGLRDLVPGTRQDSAVSGFDAVPRIRAAGVHRLRVSAVRADTPDSVLIEFELPPGLAARFEYVAGQHLVIHGSVGSEGVRRSYSLCDPGSSGRVRIAVRAADYGAFSTLATTTLSAGDHLYVSEPAGTFCLPALTEGTRLAAVAAGSGIVPVLAMLGTALAADLGVRAVLHYGSRDLAHVMLAEEVTTLVARHPDRLRVIHHLSRTRRGSPLPNRPGQSYRRGRMTTVELLGEEADLWLLCGPRPLLVEARQGLLGQGATPPVVLTELFETRAAKPRSMDTAGLRSYVSLDGAGPSLEFEMDRNALILDEAIGMRPDLPYSCLGGACGACLGTVESGTVSMGDDPLLAITADQRAAGQVLVCRSRPASDEVRIRFVP